MLIRSCEEDYDFINPPIYGKIPEGVKIDLTSDIAVISSLCLRAKTIGAENATAQISSESVTVGRFLSEQLSSAIVGSQIDTAGIEAMQTFLDNFAI